jgi:hypothetical protein
VVACLIASGASARADDDAPDGDQFVFVPFECIQFLLAPGGSVSPLAWDAHLSFAACIQDASVYRVDRADEIEPLVEHLQTAMDPALQFYVAAIERGPGPTRVRAAYYIALGQVALITRARVSVISPPLREPLEAALEPHAKLAYMICIGIERAVANDPDLAPDVVTRYMVRSAHELAAALRQRWRIPGSDDKRLLALEPDR